MVAAPLLATGVPIEVPQTQAAALNIEQKPLVLSIDDKCTIYLNDQPVAIDGLVDRLAAVTQSNFDETIYVRGDTNANFGCIAQALAIVTVAGYHKVSLMTQEQKVIPVTEPDKR
jgi:biopolymer transport protein TolR